MRTPQSRSQSGPRASHSFPLFSPCTEAPPVLIGKPPASWMLFCSPLGPQSIHRSLIHSFIHLPFLLVSFYPVPTPPTSSESLLMCLLGLFQRKPSFLFFALTDFVLDHLSFRLLARTSPLIQVSANLSCGQTSWLPEPNQSPTPLDCLLCFSGLSDLTPKLT